MKHVNGSVLSSQLMALLCVLLLTISEILNESAFSNWIHGKFTWYPYRYNSDILPLAICIYHNIVHRNSVCMSRHCDWTRIHWILCLLRCIACNPDSRSIPLNMLHNAVLGSQFHMHTCQFHLRNCHSRRMHRNRKLFWNKCKQIEIKTTTKNHFNWFALLTLANIRMVPVFSIWSIESSFAFGAIASGGIMETLLAYTLTFALIKSAMVWMAITIARCSKKSTKSYSNQNWNIQDLYLRSHSNGCSFVFGCHSFCLNPGLHLLQQMPSVLCWQWYPNALRSSLKWPFCSQYPRISMSFTA